MTLEEAAQSYCKAWLKYLSGEQVSAHDEHQVLIDLYVEMEVKRLGSDTGTTEAQAGSSEGIVR